MSWDSTKQQPFVMVNAVKLDALSYGISYTFCRSFTLLPVINYIIASFIMQDRQAKQQLL